MRRPAVALALVAALATATLAALAAQSQPASTRWEYTLLEGIQQPSPDGNGFRFIHRACRAAAGDWQCRNFVSEPAVSADMAFREALFTLGQDGWELVATVSPSENALGGPSYLFKRQLP
jgi:hypothetical protein